MGVKTIHVSTYTGGIVGPSLAMLGPVEDGGTIVAQTAPGCWGPLITPHFRGGHEVTQPVAVEGANVGDAIAIKIRTVRVMSRATASGTSQVIAGRRFTDRTLVVTRCPQCGAENPPTHQQGIGPDAVRCGWCGAGAIPLEMTCGYTMVFNEERSLGITVAKHQAEEIALRAAEYAALPENSEQHPVLILGNADLPGILTRVRPLVGNIGTTPAIDVGDSGNRGDWRRFETTVGEPGANSEQADPLTDAHMDIDSVREGTIVICPVKVEGGGVYLGDVHAMQGQSEIAGHTTDVSAEVTLEVRVIKGLKLGGPILLPLPADLPFLARPFNRVELQKGRRLAQEWNTTLEEGAPIQVVGSGQSMKMAVWTALERASRLLDMSLDEVRNRTTITGSVELGHSGMARISLLVPIQKLERLGILALIKEQYDL